MITQKINELKVQESVKLSEIESLKSELTNEIKARVSGDYQVTVSQWATYIMTCRNSSRNQITMYHDSNLKGKRKYEMSWFSSRFIFDADSNNYTEYLIILGQFVQAMKVGMEDVFETYLNKIDVIQNEIRDINQEIHNIIYQNKVNRIKEITEGDKGTIKMNGTFRYIKSKKTEISYDIIDWVKSKKGYNVIFKYFEDSEGSKISMTESDFTEFLMSKFENILN